MLSSSAIYGTHCGAGYAAKMLHVSVGTVHGLIRSGRLQAWRTKGGHHRISLSSLERHASDLGLPVSKIMINARLSFRVMIIEDDKKNQELFRLELPQWGINPVIHKSGPNALLDIAIFRPQVLLMNAASANLDFAEIVKVLRGRYGSKIQILTMLNSNSRQDVGQFSLPELGIFRFPENIDKLKQHLLNLKHNWAA